MIEMPQITKTPPSSFTTKEGQNVSLYCSAKGFPKPIITWFKDGNDLDADYYDADTGQLTFPSIQFHDRGVYRCVARNFLGSQSATVEIIVQGKLIQ